MKNFVQVLLADKKWRVQPNAYFLDKDTSEGRELDIKAIYDDFESSGWGFFILNLLIQCSKLPGNAWIFFAVPRPSIPHTRISKCDLAGFLKFGDLRIFEKSKETHFGRSQVLATNYCEIITDKDRSNKRNDNIWKNVITLAKSTSQELEQEQDDSKQYLEDLGSFDKFARDPFEVISIYYPLIVFEGIIYEAKFSDDEIMLEEREYVHLFVDYKSGRYEGEFCIDIITKEYLPDYLEDVMRDLTIFDRRRLRKSKEYQKIAFEKVKEYFASHTLDS